MFARSVSMRLEAKLLTDLTRTTEDEVLPSRPKQPGFQSKNTISVAGGAVAVAISAWDRKDNAEACGLEPNPHMRKPLEKIIEGSAAIQTLEVIFSTFHPLAAQDAALA